jgi:hypothetical protein
MRIRRGLRMAVAGALLAVVTAACGGSPSSGPATSASAGEGSESPMTAPPGSASSGGSAAAGQLMPAPVIGGTTLEAPPKTVTPPVALEGLKAWLTAGEAGGSAPPPGALENTHVPGPVSYQVVPPVGGPHNPIWMNAGVYTQPVPTERAVHLMEHGAVWITYRPDLAADQVAALTAFVGKQTMIPEPSISADQANRYVVLSPWKDGSLPAPVVISAWGFQLQVQDAADPRLQTFVDTFRHSRTYTPEFGSPVDGVPILTGGRPDADGSAVPNPEGAVTQ